MTENSGRLPQRSTRTYRIAVLHTS